MYLSRSVDSDSACNALPMHLALRFHTHNGVGLRGEFVRSFFDSLVSWITRRWTLRCHVYLGVGLCGVTSTVELDSAVSCLPRSWTLRCHVYRGVGLCSVIPIAEFKKIQISGQDQNLIRKFLPSCQGSNGVYLRKNRGRKYCDTLS